MSKTSKYSDIPISNELKVMGDEMIKFSIKSREMLDIDNVDIETRRKNFIELCEKFKIVVCADAKLVDEMNPKMSMILWAEDKDAPSGLRCVMVPKKGFDYTFPEFISTCYSLIGK